MKLGIFGGTFDPIHHGHLLIAEVTREALRLDQVLFVPAGDPPHKQGLEKTAAHHRQNMVRLAIANNPFFEISTVDLDRSGPHYSVDTVQLIRAQYNLPAQECAFIIGGDSLADLPAWHNPAQLITLCRLAVVYRPGYEPDLSQLEQAIPGLVDRIDWVEIPVVDFSASKIRAKVAAGRTIRYQVPEQVRSYIQENKLYSKEYPK